MKSVLSIIISIIKTTDIMISASSVQLRHPPAQNLKNKLYFLLGKYILSQLLLLLVCMKDKTLSII